jgi:DNA polymerase-4
MNSCYASIECLYNPDIRDKPVAVCGDPEARHGIVLTKNQIAKKYGVQTGEAICIAKQKCPALVCVPPDYPLYERFSHSLRKILSDYSDKIASYGIDEAWFDLSGPKTTIEDGKRIADEIRRRTVDELGVTVSVGVSFNRIFAKLGSDMKKPDATTTISHEDYQGKVWPLPASDLLFVGPSATVELRRRFIYTIGDIAKAPETLLKSALGIKGLMLKAYALGLDNSPVKPTIATAPVDSVSNSITPRHNLENMDDAKCIFFMLAESIAARLRENGFRSRCIAIGVRDTQLVTTSRQRTIKTATALTGEIGRMAMQLFGERYGRSFPYRSVGLKCSSLVPEGAPEQLDLFGNHEEREKEMELEYVVDGLRRRYGHKCVVRGVTMTDKDYALINPREEHTIHPMPF